MPKTRAEKFQLYKDINITGSTPFAPAKILDPNTEVEILQEEAGFYQTSYSYVEVMDGPHAKAFGYLPIFALLACDVLQSQVGLSTVKTTGVTYGGSGVPKGETVQTSFVARGHGLHFTLPFKGKEGCRYCGGTAESHTMEESQEAKRLALAVHTAIAGWRNNVGGQFMIGVLQVVTAERQRTLLAVSDGFPQPREDDLENVADDLRLRFIKRSDVNDWKYLRDFTGKTISRIGATGIDIKNMYRDYLQCAGPKLLQYLLHSYQTDEIRFHGKLYLSEVWYEPRNIHEHYGNERTAESCSKCAILIPRMLCGYTPKK